MNKSIEEIIDSLATKYSEEWDCHPDLKYHSEYGKINRAYLAGAQEGYALGLEQAKVLVECLEQISNDSANEVAYLAEEALKLFKERGR